MASVIDDPNGRRRIQFTDPDGKRQTIRLGKIARNVAEQFARHVEELVSARAGSYAVHPRTAAWLGDLGDKYHEKLVAVSLVEARESANVMTVQGLFDEYMRERTDLKPGTAVNLNQSGRAMVAIFGASRPIAKVTEADAENFYRKLIADGLAQNTARRRTA